MLNTDACGLLLQTKWRGPINMSVNLGRMTGVYTSGRGEYPGGYARGRKCPDRNVQRKAGNVQGKCPWLGRKLPEPRLIGCLCVGQDHVPCNNGRTGRNAIWWQTGVGSTNHVLD